MVESCEPAGRCGHWPQESCGAGHRLGGEKIKPGILGYWPAASEVIQGAQRDRLDVYYIQNWSLSLDLEIMLLNLKRLRNLFAASKVRDEVDKEGGV